MEHKLSCCQELTIGKNTASFWNANLRDKKSKILNSPIFVRKNELVLKHLTALNGKILDIGLGYGYIEQLISKRKLELELFGIDISKFAIENARKKFKGNFSVSNIYKIPFKDNLFDCALALDILEHLPKARIDKALSEVSRVLKINGLFIVSIPLNETTEDRLSNRHIRVYDENVIKSELMRNSFNVIRTYNLTAFKKLFRLKNFVNDLFKFKDSNLLILICKKSHRL